MSSLGHKQWSNTPESHGFSTGPLELWSSHSKPHCKRYEKKAESVWVVVGLWCYFRYQVVRKGLLKRWSLQKVLLKNPASQSAFSCHVLLEPLIWNHPFAFFFFWLFMTGILEGCRPVEKASIWIWYWLCSLALEGVCQVSSLQSHHFFPL